MDEDKENDDSECDFYLNTRARTLPTKKSSILFGRSAMKPVAKPNLLGLSPRQAPNQGRKRALEPSSLDLSMSVPPKKRSFDSSALGLSMSAKPKRLRLV